MAKLFLIPNVLSDGNWQNVLPVSVFNAINETQYFIAENVRTVRRFLKHINHEIDIDALNFFELNKFTPPEDLPGLLKPVEMGFNTGIISDAGCPGIADPGADIVKIAHRKNIQVVPLVGPSSVLLALMASGLNGQNFAFNGYLPIKPYERTKVISILERKAKSENQTQIFIETPYRNKQLIADLLKSCQPSTMLCIAANITGKNEFIITKSVGEWKDTVPDLNKQPVIFLLGL
ncbi:MAG: SAM-dependent methyltransferase [Bacteroidales bacterium]|jgi:16S rRNA (cytidine1402-2'-O)-methyltransferase|nr:SAM-dependent methyltransferase [Bacteroidales bacterium]